VILSADELVAPGVQRRLYLFNGPLNKITHVNRLPVEVNLTRDDPRYV